MAHGAVVVDDEDARGRGTGRSGRHRAIVGPVCEVVKRSRAIFSPFGRRNPLQSARS
jgi:hypothetical protein